MIQGGRLVFDCPSIPALNWLVPNVKEPEAWGAWDLWGVRTRGKRQGVAPREATDPREVTAVVSWEPWAGSLCQWREAAAIRSHGLPWGSPLCPLVGNDPPWALMYLPQPHLGGNQTYSRDWSFGRGSPPHSPAGLPSLLPSGCGGRDAAASVDRPLRQPCALCTRCWLFRHRRGLT